MVRFSCCAQYHKEVIVRRISVAAKVLEKDILLHSSMCSTMWYMIAASSNTTSDIRKKFAAARSCELGLPLDPPTVLSLVLI
jgi:hypothetical protein